MDYSAKYHEYALQAAAAYKSYAMTEEDTQECAEFLLTLKHRSVTPEPQSELQDCIESKPQTPIGDSTSTPQGNNVLASIDDADSDVDRTGRELQPPALMEEQSTTTAIWEKLLGDSPLVSMEDRDLVPDPLFVVMGQMKPCTLTEADRVGCYKARPLGFVGMSCKHCSGQPGFGKYFPETVRSLAQTTTSQTILKHIGSKCRFCPSNVRKSVLELQRQQVIKESTNTGRPRYGSRKVFFQRIWSRLHDQDEITIDTSETEERTPTCSPHHSDVEVDTQTAKIISCSDDSSPRRKLESSQQPTKKSFKKRKLFSDFGSFKPCSKHSRVEWAH